MVSALSIPKELGCSTTVDGPTEAQAVSSLFDPQRAKVFDTFPRHLVAGSFNPQGAKVFDQAARNAARESTAKAPLTLKELRCSTI